VLPLPQKSLENMIEEPKPQQTVNNVQYQWAHDQEGHTVHISDITADNRRQKFTCPNCKEILVPVIGTGKKAPHFRHKNAEACSYESYVHAIAKEILAYRFNHCEKLEIKYHATKQCEKHDQCRMRQKLNLSCCEPVALWNVIDLKQIYDTCEIEKGYGGFRADVLLSSSRDSSVRPLFLEVEFTHPCDEEKINSGHQIIEIKVGQEMDAMAPLVEGWQVKFYNFERSLPISPLELHRLSFIGTDEIIDRYEYTKVPCTDSSVSDDCQMIIDSLVPLTYLQASSIAAKHLPQYKDCLLCKNNRTCFINTEDDKRISVRQLNMNSAIKCASLFCPTRTDGLQYVKNPFAITQSRAHYNKDTVYIRTRH